ncbi:MAG: site-2 protease family protein [Micrococcaceae bacterium]
MITVLLYIAGVLLVALGIGISIALHEVGHLVPAKKFGVKVKQYMIGFGPTIYSKKKGDTEYGIKAIPLGGYISMIGMLPPTAHDAPGTVRSTSTGMFQSLAEDARKFSAEEIGPGDENRVFYKLPIYKRVIIMLGGPFMNIVIAFVLFSILITTFGVAKPTTQVASVSQCVVSVQEMKNQQREECLPDDPKAPAAVAGIKPGDKITGFNGTTVTSWDLLSEQIRDSAGKPVALTVNRNGKTETLQVTPILSERPETDALGMPIKDSAGNYVTLKVGFLGIGPTSEMQKQPLGAVFPMIGNNIKATVKVILNLPQRMIDVWHAAFSDAPRDIDSPMSVVGVGRAAGEIASNDKINVTDKFATIISLIAGLNIALFVFNLVPLLPLDGGHVAGALWEGIRRFFAKLFGRKDPGPFDLAKMLPLTYVMVGILLAMSALLIYADIVKPISLFN